MFEIEKTYYFEAGHVLCHHEEKCSQPHGHSYVMKIKLRQEKLQSSGSQTNMVVDFYQISQAVKPMIEDYLDHRWLNDTLQTDSPTAEFIACWIFHHLEPFLPGLYSVTIFETPTCSASYIKTV